ncbi:hypothetical protein [Pikeienuella sp. HZG-20]
MTENGAMHALFDRWEKVWREGASISRADASESIASGMTRPAREP